ncbi:FlgD immunoglobulin-like domain containing protein [Streptomyces sp. NPDC046374]|uniref:FlgD immunoglobulin-like domain containing protein n=1 Tax=Streptomyces sp. NPDC046374 TaxID=3154917 RepID=UPI0033F6ABD4
MGTGWGRRRRGALALAAATAALVALTPVGAGVAYAAGDGPPAELVIPAEEKADPYASIVRPGTTGFLQGDAAGEFRWYSYADGGSTAFADGGAQIHGNGTDTFARVDERLGKVVLQDAAGGPEETLAIGAGRHVLGLAGRTVVAESTAGDGTLHTYALVNGAPVDRPVTGLPSGAGEFVVQGTAPSGFLLSYRVDQVSALAWVDLSGGTPRVRELGDDLRSAFVQGDDLLTVTAGGKLRVRDLAGDWSAPARETDWTGDAHPVAVRGDRILSARDDADGRLTLQSRPFEGGAQTKVLDGVTLMPRSGGGPVLAVVDDKPALARPVYRVAVGADGEFAATKVAVVPARRTLTLGVTAAQGVLNAVDEVPQGGEHRLRSLALTTGGPLAAGDRVDRGTDPERDRHFGVPTGDGRTVFPSGFSLYALEAGAQLPPVYTGAWDVGPGPAVGASGRYAAYTDVAGARRVFDLDARADATPPGLVKGAATALNGGTLWAANATPGALAAIDVRTRATARKLTVADCVLKDVQAVGADVYWKCDAKSGVLNTVTQVNTALPAHTSARLGDGYVTHEKDGLLSLTPLRGGGATRELGRPADERPERGWSIDRFGGHTVFADAQQRLHVVPSGVPASDLSVLDSALPGEVFDVETGAPWTAKWWLSKPAASWTLSVKDKAGKVVRTLRGGETRGLVKAVWDGKDDTGAEAVDGWYAYELAVVPADGAGSELRRGGETLLTHGGLGAYEPVTPTRILDTRSGLGARKAPLYTGDTLTLQVAGRAGVPARGVSAVVLNVTATNASASTYVSVYPYGTQRSTASNLNVTAGRTASNLVTVPVKDGKVTLYNFRGSVDLLADVAGSYTMSGPGDRFAPVAPARVLDTRSGLGAPKAKVGPARTVDVRVAGRGGVPAAGVSAVVVNVTATGPTAAGFVSVYPYGTQRTSASNLNTAAGQTVANAVIVPVRDGRITLYNHAGSVDLLADVSGYFGAGAQGALFHPLAPARLVDTRKALGGRTLGPAQSLMLPIAGIGGVPASGASAVVLNLTGTGATRSTYLAATTVPGTPKVSSVNLLPGRTVPNLVVVPVVDGKLYLYNHAGSTDVIVDVFGYFTG